MPESSILTDCWEWPGPKTVGGYGTLTYKSKTWLAHRLCYTMHKGEIPPGLVIDHLCGYPGCVNPDHLEAVTQRVNINRGKTADFQRDKTHCPHGHPYLGSNLYLHPKGYRRCRTCRRASMRVK